MNKWLAIKVVSDGMPAQIRRFATGMVLVGACILPTLAASQTGFPNRAVTLVVPYPPGGSTDMIAREYADRMGRELGQTVVVENRPGASTNIGMAAVARSNADGYTLLFGGNGMVINPIFGPESSFDGANAFSPISKLAEVPFIVAANVNAPFNTPVEMIRAAQDKPGSVTISSAQLHLYVEYLKSSANANLLHIPYKGGAQSVTDTIAGQVDTVYSLTPVALPHVHTKKLKPIGVTSAQRVAILPDTPTFKESGIDYVVTIWYGIFAPAGTPENVIQHLNQVTQKVLKAQDFIDKLGESGVRLEGSTPQELKKLVGDQQVEWRKVFKAMPELKR